MTKEEFLILYRGTILTLYPNTKQIYGPYYAKDGRCRIVLHSVDGKSKTRQFARLKMEVVLNRRLTQSETVDHIDRDYTNDELDNLQILGPSEHGKKDALKRVPIIAGCVWCKKSFELTRYNLREGHAGPFCSKTCTGQYSRSVQLGGAVLEDKETIPREYYK